MGQVKNPPDRAILPSLNTVNLLDKKFIFRAKKLKGIQFWIKVQFESNFKGQNVTNEILHIKVKIQVNFERVKGQLPGGIGSWNRCGKKENLMSSQYHFV